MIRALKFFTMALIKLSSIGITNLSGKAGGSVYAHNRGGNYIRNFVVPSNPKTALQAAARAAFGALSSAWRSLTQEARNAWKEAATSFPYINRLGEQKIMSGLNLYVSLNRNLGVIGQPSIDMPPIPQGVDGVASVEMTAQSSAAGVLAALNAPAVLQGNEEATTIYAVYATPPLAAGIGYAENKLRLLTTQTETQVTEGDYVTDYEENFTASVPVGSKIFLAIDPINQRTGERGARVIVSAVVTESI